MLYVLYTHCAGEVGADADAKRFCSKRKISMTLPWILTVALEIDSVPLIDATTVRFDPQ